MVLLDDTDAGLFDDDVLSEIFRAMEPAKVTELLIMARTTLDALFDSLDQAVTASQTERIIAAAHRLKGMAGQAGLRALSAELGHLHNATRSGDLCARAACFDAVRRLTQLSRDGIDRLLARG
jgi:HPt (histidine-containing phosphotransfer) domain-containing protein